MPMKRSDVYARLDDEREYQAQRWPKERPHSFEEWFTYMRDYISEAEHILSRTATPEAQEPAANIMRKVTAMGIAALEQHGCPWRTPR